MKELLPAQLYIKSKSRRVVFEVLPKTLRLIFRMWRNKSFCIPNIVESDMRSKKSEVVNEDPSYQNRFHSIAYDTAKKRLIEMVNVYTGEHRVLSLWQKIKIFFF